MANRLGDWQNPKKVLPLPDKLVLLKLDAYEYRFAQLFEITQPDGDAQKGTIVAFLGETDSEGCYGLDDVKAWCYAKIDELEWDE